MKKKEERICGDERETSCYLLVLLAPRALGILLTCKIPFPDKVKAHNKNTRIVSRFWRGTSTTI